MKDRNSGGILGWFGVGPALPKPAASNQAVDSQRESLSTDNRSNSTTAAQAHAEAERYLDGADRPGGLDESGLAALTPEARMFAIRVLAHSSGNSRERAMFEAAQLMRDGQATIGELVEDIRSMSPEGRAYARQVLTSHPEYRVKGLRWHQNPLDLGELAVSGNPVGYTSYQTTVDLVVAAADPEWETATSLIDRSKGQAATGDWAGAAKTISESIAILEGRESYFPEPMLAVALYHREAYLGQQGDSIGARHSIERAIPIFAKLCEADPAYAPDLAQASQSYSYCLAEQGDLDGALAAIDASIDVMVRHFKDIGSQEQVAFASAYETKCEIQIRMNDASGAYQSLQNAEDRLALVAEHEVADKADLIAHLRTTLQRKRARFA